MQALTMVSHAHHEVLRGYVRRLYELTECLCPDCLDTPGALSEECDLRELIRGLREQLIPHMEVVEAAVYPTLERIAEACGASAPMLHEHEQIRRLVDRMGAIVDMPAAELDRSSFLALRRVMLRLHVLLATHLTEEELYLPILEDRLSPEGEAALGRALDHLAASSL